ncbi:hypothetical protein ACWHY4_13915 [Pseudomonas sp. E2-15]
MSTEWQLPPAYESRMFKSYTIAMSLIKSFADGDFEPPQKLVSSIRDYLATPDNPKSALSRFTAQLNIAPGERDVSDDPIIQATLIIAIVLAWASSETENRFSAFWKLARHSWWIENLWVDAALVIANQDTEFKSAILGLADKHFNDAEKELLEKYGMDPENPITLDEIWHGHLRESYTDSSSWSWVKLLANLTPNKLFELMNFMQSPFLLNRILDSPEFDQNLELWEHMILKAPASFESDGSWQGGALLPSLIRHGGAKIVHLGDSTEHPPAVLEPHIRSLLTRFVDTLAQRSDFEGMFKRWGTWLTRQHLHFPVRAPGRKVILDSQDIFWALAEKISPSSSKSISKMLDNSWEPWVYQSMLALLHSKMPEQFSAPDVKNFIKEWYLTPTDWNSKKGQKLRRHTDQYHANRPNTYACRVLGFSIALSDDFTNHWLKMWKGSVVLREILEFRPVYQISGEWKPADASGLMRTLVDIGLGILDCTASDQDALEPEVAPKSSALFQALWDATTEMLNIDIYGDDFWALMQQHLAIRRVQWTVGALKSPENEYLKLLDQTATPSSITALKLMRSNTSTFISLLPMLLQNNVTKEGLRHLLNDADVNLTELALSAAKYQDAPERKFKILPHHVNLIEELA